MIRRVFLGTILVLAAVSTAAWAQAPQAPGADPRYPASPPAQRPGSPPPGGMGGMMGGMPMTGMMCPMMGGMMGGGMMGGMMPMPGGGGPADSPRMLQMRGEMLKAMGEILMKYGKMMDGGARPQ